MKLFINNFVSHTYMQDVKSVIQKVYNTWEGEREREREREREEKERGQ